MTDRLRALFLAAILLVALVGTASASDRALDAHRAYYEATPVEDLAAYVGWGNYFSWARDGPLVLLVFERVFTEQDSDIYRTWVRVQDLLGRRDPGYLPSPPVLFFAFYLWYLSLKV